MPPVITTSLLSATAINVSWSQPRGTFPAFQYNISLSRATGEGQLLCDSVLDNRAMTLTSFTSLKYNDLHEFSNYTMTVTAIVLNKTETSVIDFVTSSSGKF